MDEDRRRRLEHLSERLGHRFGSLELLETALMHRSAAAESGVDDNERLEFLGDAVLELVSSEWLFTSRPTESEGLLTQRRSRLVSAVALKAVAEKMGLQELVVLSEGEARSGGRLKRSVLANTVEALIGAVYLDSGLGAAAEWILPYLQSLDVELVDSEVADAKNRLQEFLQADGGPLPEYRTVAQDGPAHAPHFVVECWIDGKAAGSGSGSTKQRAQRRAAVDCLEQLTTAH